MSPEPAPAMFTVSADVAEFLLATLNASSFTVGADGAADLARLVADARAQLTTSS